jgi:GT2 family glycosyltransferase
MIYFFTPYSFEKKMFHAWEQYMNLLGDDDWAVMMDGDIMFFQANFGHIVKEYIDKYPDTGLFTCYASRSGTGYMMPPGAKVAGHNIMIHQLKAKQLEKANHLQVQEIKKRVTGHFMAMKKSTWNKIYEDAKERCKDFNVLTVDTEISHAILAAGLKIRLMKGLYVYHYYRLAEGDKRKNELT